MEELIDYISEGISDAFCSNAFDTADITDGLHCVSEDSFNALLDGNFTLSDIDYTSLFENIDDGIEEESVRNVVASTNEAYNCLSNNDEYNMNIMNNNADYAEEISFGSKYTEDEIQKFKSDVDKAQYEMKCRENDVNNWESKVSLNNTKEHRLNGDYDNALKRLNEAKSRYNFAANRYNDAVSRYNNAK